MAAQRRHSKKRDALINALAATTEHPSAETLYLQLKAEYPDISLGTIYRNLSQLRQDGEIIIATMVSGQERFDYNTKPHSHFVCDECGSVYDLPSVSPKSDWPDRVEKEYGHIVKMGELTFHGICRECRRAAQN